MLSLEKYEVKFLEFIQKEVAQDLAHDIKHILRVVKSAKLLCEQEDAKKEVVIPSAYLHDCVSFEKNSPKREQSSKFAADKALIFLESIHYPTQYFQEIHHAILAHSFSANIETKTLEAEIVQDADRLDALGSIGIARCFLTGAKLNIELYADDDTFCLKRIPNDKTYAIDHFYAKLLKLADTMKTKSAKLEAQKRTEFMYKYLEQLETEI